MSADRNDKASQRDVMREPCFTKEYRPFANFVCRSILVTTVVSVVAESFHYFGGFPVAIIFGLIIGLVAGLSSALVTLSAGYLIWLFAIENRWPLWISVIVMTVVAALGVPLAAWLLTEAEPANFPSGGVALLLMVGFTFGIPCWLYVASSVFSKELTKLEGTR